MDVAARKICSLLVAAGSFLPGGALAVNQDDIGGDETVKSPVYARVVETGEEFVGLSVAFGRLKGVVILPSTKGDFCDGRYKYDSLGLAGQAQVKCRSGRRAEFMFERLADGGFGCAKFSERETVYFSFGRAASRRSLDKTVSCETARTFPPSSW